MWARDTIDKALREDVEAGTVSYNDLERTKKFASDAIHYQYYATFAGVGAVAGTVFYQHWYRRRPFNLRSLVLLPLVYTVGSAPFWLIQASAFRQYQRSLENRETTMKALLKSRGMVVLTAGEDPQRARDQPVDNASGTDNHPGSRWEELRRKAGTAEPSSWDRIRQSHEKARYNAQPKQARATPSSGETEDTSSYERDIEQAKFDALLEAERKMSDS